MMPSFFVELATVLWYRPPGARGRAYHALIESTRKLYAAQYAAPTVHDGGFTHTGSPIRIGLCLFAAGKYLGNPFNFLLAATIGSKLPLSASWEYLYQVIQYGGLDCGICLVGWGCVLFLSSSKSSSPDRRSELGSAGYKPSSVVKGS